MRALRCQGGAMALPPCCPRNDAQLLKAWRRCPTHPPVYNLPDALQRFQDLISVHLRDQEHQTSAGERKVARSSSGCTKLTERTSHGYTFSLTSRPPLLEHVAVHPVQNLPLRCARAAHAEEGSCLHARGRQGSLSNARLFAALHATPTQSPPAGLALAGARGWLR